MEMTRGGVWKGCRRDDEGTRWQKKWVGNGLRWEMNGAKELKREMKECGCR